MRRAFLAAPLWLGGCFLSGGEPGRTPDDGCLSRTCADVKAALGGDRRCGEFEDGCGARIVCDAVRDSMCEPEETCAPAQGESTTCKGENGAIAGCEARVCGTTLPETGALCLENCPRWENGGDPLSGAGGPLPSGRYAHLLAPLLGEDGRPTRLLLVGGYTADDTLEPLAYYFASDAWLLDVAERVGDGEKIVVGEPLPAESGMPRGAYFVGGGGVGEVVFGMGETELGLDPAVWRFADGRFERIGPDRSECAARPEGCPFAYGAAGAYEPVSRTLWLFGGDPEGDGDTTDALWSFSVQERSWTRHERSSADAPWPKARFFASGAMASLGDPPGPHFALFGGDSAVCLGGEACVEGEADNLDATCAGGDGCAFGHRDTPLADLWFFDLQARRWERATRDPDLSPRYGAGLAWDQARGALAITAGRGRSTGFLEGCNPPSQTGGNVNLGDSWFWQTGRDVRDGRWQQLRLFDLGDELQPAEWSQCVGLALHMRLAPARDGALVGVGGQLPDIHEIAESPLMSRLLLFYGALAQ